MLVSRKLLPTWVSGGTVTPPTLVADGVNWTYNTQIISTGWGNKDIWTSTWSGSNFIIGGEAGAIATSPDGATWTYRTGLQSTTWGSTNVVYCVIWTGSVFSLEEMLVV